MDKNNQKEDEKIKKNILDNIKLTNINYYNYYENYYIIMDDENLYSYEKDYSLLDKVSKEKICQMDYPIIYENNQFVYIEDESKDKNITYKYYDIYDCKLINTISLGG